MGEAKVAGAPVTRAREVDAHAVVGCLLCEGTVDTSLALKRERLGDGLRWIGVPCSDCGRTFTVELQPLPEEGA